MNIVYIGADKRTASDFVRIRELRDAGHDVFVSTAPGYEQLVRRIIDADEIHVWDLTREFELGMVYFFSVHALHHGLRWRVRLFGDAQGGWELSTVFRGIAGACLTCGGRGRIRHWYAMDELGWKDCPECTGPPPCERGTGGCDAERATICASRGGCAKKPNIEIVVGSAKDNAPKTGGLTLAKPSCVVQGRAKFVPPCHSGVGPCNDCAREVECDRLRAEHNG